MPRNMNDTDGVLGKKPNFRQEAGIQVARAMDTGADSGKRDMAGKDKYYVRGAHKMSKRSKRKGGRKY